MIIMLKTFVVKNSILLSVMLKIKFQNDIGIID